MAKEIKTEILINAAPEKVWSILTDFDKYPDWNPFIKSITGNVAIGVVARTQKRSDSHTSKISARIN